MPRACTICTHDERHSINVALVQREPYRRIAARFGVSTGALQRHAREHIPELLVKAAQAVEVADADDLLGRLTGMLGRLEAFLDRAEAGEDGAEFRANAAEWRKHLELLAKLRGELQQEGVTNLNLHPEWVELRAVIVAALAPHPEAREAVLRAVSQPYEEVNGGR